MTTMIRMTTPLPMYISPLRTSSARRRPSDAPGVWVQEALRSQQGRERAVWAPDPWAEAQKASRRDQEAVERHEEERPGLSALQAGEPGLR
jgi:hypothetical protein